MKIILQFWLCFRALSENKAQTCRGNIRFGWFQQVFHVLGIRSKNYCNKYSLAAIEKLEFKVLHPIHIFEFACSPNSVGFKKKGSADLEIKFHWRPCVVLLEKEPRRNFKNTLFLTWKPYCKMLHHLIMNINGWLVF